MTRSTFLRSTITLLALAAIALPLHGDPPILLGPDSLASLATTRSAGLDPTPIPRLAGYSNSGCLNDDGDQPWPCGEDEFELGVAPGTLHVTHRNAIYNCCLDEIAVSLSVHGTLIRLTEEEVITMPCDCICCFDVEATVVDLAPGTYTLEFCWFNYETREFLCYLDEIVVPPRDRPLPGDPPVVLGPEAVVARTPGEASPRAARPTRPPRVLECVRTGCLEDSDDPRLPPCGDDEIVLAADEGTLHVLHENATYNCCLDDIVISVAVEGDLIMLTEEELLTDPCYCVCCFDVAATVVDLAPGTYTVEFCWFDYDTGRIEVYLDEILIP